MNLMMNLMINLMINLMMNLIIVPNITRGYKNGIPELCSENTQCDACFRYSGGTAQHAPVVFYLTQPVSLVLGVYE